MFYFEELKGRRILKSDFIQGPQAFFTTRESVIKSDELEKQKLIEENKNIICEYLNIDLKNFIFPIQTHSSNIDIVQENKFDYPNTDGLILKDKNKAIFLNFADCVPIILYDEKQNIGAVSHAGWRGTAQSIAKCTVEKMIKKFDSQAEDIIAVIGPAISPCCYNVGEEVFEKLKKTVKNFKNLYEIFNDKIHVDLKSINKRQLEEVGLKKIDVCPYCTSCDNEYFFSYRKENGTTSRHSAVLELM